MLERFLKVGLDQGSPTCGFLATCGQTPKAGRNDISLGLMQKNRQRYRIPLVAIHEKVWGLLPKGDAEKFRFRSQNLSTQIKSKQ